MEVHESAGVLSNLALGELVHRESHKVEHDHRPGEADEPELDPRPELPHVNFDVGLQKTLDLLVCEIDREEHESDLAGQHEQLDVADVAVEARHKDFGERKRTSSLR